MKKIILFSSLFTFFVGTAQNLLTNGDFSNGSTGWTLTGGTVTNGEATFTTTNAAGDPWSTQLTQNGFAFTSGTSYTLTFKARAASNRNITVAVQNFNVWDNQTANVTHALTTTMQTFTQTFNAATTNANVNLAFLLANQNASTAAVYIDDVTLAVATVTPPALSPVLGFETTETGGLDGGPFGNGIYTVETSVVGTNTSKVLKVVGNTTGDIWQGINLNLTTPVNLTTTKTMTMDVYSATPITFLVKSTGANPVAAAAVTHSGNATWQTLTFTFNTALDGQAATANNTYPKFVIHTYWATGATAFGTVTADARTFYVDNLKGPLGAVVVDPAPTTSAPNPTHGNADVVMSMFNDKPGYTNAYGPEGDFGTRTLVNLDAELDQTIKMNFGIAGWGQYDNSPPSVATANFLHLSYYVPTFAAGSNGHGFWIMLNSGSGEKQYRIGNGNTPNSQNSPIVFDSWQTVSIPMSHFTGQGFNPATLLSWKLGSDSDLNTKFVYFDNIFFTTQALNNDSLSKNTVSIYPNPVQDILTINALDTINSVEIFNINGQKMYARLNNNTVDVTNLSSGVYLLNVELSNGSKEVMKFVK